MKKFLTLALTAVMALSLLTACGSKNDNSADTNTDGSNTETTLSGTVSTDGSTSMEKVINSLGESFMAMNKDVKFTYNPTGSGSGIQAVSEGRCDIGLSSRALKDDEKASGLVETVVALDGIAIVVNPENPVSDLDVDTIAKIYTGEITNWKDVGGNDAEIVLIGREAGSGTRDGFESITDTKDACQYRQELTSTGDVITTVSQNPNAIGYASLAAILQLNDPERTAVCMLADKEEIGSEGWKPRRRPSRTAAMWSSVRSCSSRRRAPSFPPRHRPSSTTRCPLTRQASSPLPVRSQPTNRTQEPSREAA